MKYMVNGALLLLCFAAVPCAQLDKDEQAKIERLAIVLSLTPEQKKSVAGEREKSSRSLKTLERKWQRLHRELRDEVQKSRPDNNRIERISADIGTVQGEVVLLRTRSLVQVKSILSKSQRHLLEQGNERAR